MYCNLAGLAAGTGAARLTIALRQPYPWIGFLNKCEPFMTYDLLNNCILRASKYCNLQLYYDDHIFMYAHNSDLLTGTLDCFLHDHYGPSGMKFSKVLEISL